MLKIVLTAVLCLLVRVASAEPVTVIRNNGTSANRLDLVILGDGYTAQDIASGKYANDVETFVAGFFNEEPFNEYRNYFNVHRVDVTSADSGADKPASGVYVNTALDATYYCGSIQRLICVNFTKVTNIVTASIPNLSARDTILVIVNDQEYGGSGGSIAVASTNQAVVELILHEIGHTLGQLADEYDYGPPSCNNTSEPSAVNATRQTSLPLIKWNHWISPGTPIPTFSSAPAVPGLYQGAQYCVAGLYRPTFNSKMRNLGFSYEQINTEQLIKRFYNYVSPIDGVTSGSSFVVPFGQTKLFSVTTPPPLTHALGIEWRVNGQLASTSPNYSFVAPIGSYTVELRVNDSTASVRNDPANLLRAIRTFTVQVVGRTTGGSDFDRDGRSDIGVYRPSDGQWYVRKSTNNWTVAGYLNVQWGLPGDLPIPKDFDGDGQVDLVVYRPSNGEWYIRYSSSNYALAGFGQYQWGLPGDTPIAGDFDGDGRADLIVYRPSNGEWFVRYSSTGYAIAGFGHFQWGLPGDVPMSADFDADGRTDLVVYRPSTGEWFIRYSSTGYAIAGFGYYQWGLPDDVPLSGDFDGDGKSDLVVYRPSTGEWFIKYSANGYQLSGFGYYQWGLSGDVPMIGDFDGDGRTELTVYRPSSGEWYIKYSSNGYALAGFGYYQWGLANDMPLPAR